MQDTSTASGNGAVKTGEIAQPNQPLNAKGARAITFDAQWVPLEAIEHIFAVRFAEALALSAALNGEDDEAHHAFRLSCKRLRYAIERSEIDIFGLDETAKWLSSMTDALGEAHDAVVLIEETTTCGAYAAARSLQKARDSSVAEARRLWTSGFEPGGAAQPLIHILTSTAANVVSV
jgi:CHAD domain